MAGLDFNSICRLCVQFFEKGKVAPIFNNESYTDGITLSERIKHCSSVEVSEDDGLPTQICNTCLSKLDQSFVFRNQCVLADITLKRLKDVSFSMSNIHNLIRADIENQIIESEKADSLCSFTPDKLQEEMQRVDKIDEFDNSKKGRHIRNIHKSKSISLEKTKTPNKSTDRAECDDSEAKARKFAEASVIKNLEKVREEIQKNSIIKNLEIIKEEIKNNSVIKNSDIIMEEIKNNSVIKNSENIMEGIKNNSVIKNSENIMEEIKSNSEKRMVNKLIKPRKLKKLNKLKSSESDLDEETIIEFKQNSNSINDIRESPFSESDTGETSKHTEVPKQKRRKKMSKKEKPTSYKCKYCSKVYTSEGGWRYHIHTTHDENYQPFLCDLCGKAFKVKKNLEAHKNSIHFHLKSHLCDLCGRGFATKYSLKVHSTLHKDEKNYTCDICGTKFRTRGKMNTHRTIHGGPKKFMCHICPRDFRWKKDFEIHMRTHTGEKPFKCSHCGKAFSSLTNMRKHEKNHKKKLEVQKKPTSGAGNLPRNEVLILCKGLEDAGDNQMN